MKKSDHVKFLKDPNIEWDDITDILIDLELEKYHYAYALSEKEIKEYDDIIELYEAYRFTELNKNVKTSGFTRIINSEFNGEIENPDELDGYEG